MRRKFFAFSLLAVPLLNLAWVFLLTLRERADLVERVVGRLGLELLVLSSSLWAVRHGRYPTFQESDAIALPERALIVLAAWLVSATALALLLAGLRPIWQRLNQRLRLTLGLLVLLALGLWLALPWLPAPAAATIHVNAVAPLGPWPPAGESFSQGGEVELQRPGYLEAALTTLAPLAPAYVRLDHLFDYYNVYQLTDGVAHYDWQALDRAVDAVRLSGAQPFLTLSYLPPDLAAGDVYGPPSDWAAWEALIYETVYHFNVERQLGIVYWEVWNEPNLPGFWHGTLDEYLQLYEVTARAALRADPTIQIGGPATASLNRWLAVGAPMYEQNWVEALARFTHARGLPLDFVSWHYYDPLPENYAWSVDQHQRWARAGDPAAPAPLLFLTEWNWSMAPAPALDTAVAAAHSAAVVAALADQPLERAFFFEVINSAAEPAGRWGLLQADADRKPVYWSHWLLSRLTGQRLPVSSNHPEVGALAVEREGQLRLLVWRYSDSDTALPTTLTLTGWPAALAPQAVLTILPADSAPPTPALTSQPLPILLTPSGDLVLTLTLRPNDVALIELAP